MSHEEKLKVLGNHFMCSSWAHSWNYEDYSRYRSMH